MEGGKTYLIVKTLITGSVRGQSLLDTLNYMEKNVLDKNSCYLIETIPLCEEMNKYTNSFFEELTKEIRWLRIKQKMEDGALFPNCSQR